MIAAKLLRGDGNQDVHGAIEFRQLGIAARLHYLRAFMLPIGIRGAESHLEAYMRVGRSEHFKGALNERSALAGLGAAYRSDRPCLTGTKPRDIRPPKKSPAVDPRRHPGPRPDFTVVRINRGVGDL